MGIHKQKFAIIVHSGLVLAGGGMIGYQKEKLEAGIKTQQKAEKQASQEGTDIA
ncbi:hypothetical protein [Neobacillus niacini]|uniref:hypothetical protein n=1 Tax=Neobacillus niacini TaxID=86668 RepID=UPI001C8EA7AC|nr:hypothetical protein [Neobacillus niacini]MBY0147534.1 hypothetical protein [Neobacillus niacini]